MIRGGPATFTSEMALVLPAECWGRFVWGAPMGRRMKPLDIGVVIGLLPTTGLTLPFISYGRSNLILSLLMTGVLVNIGSMRERVIGATATDPTDPTT